MRKIWRHGIVLAVVPLLGLLALILVHFLPTAPMREHLYWSLDMVKAEFQDELLIDGFQATLTGNFTDCLMLEHAVYTGEGHSVLDQVMHMYRAESYNDEKNPAIWHPGESLVDYLEGIKQPREVEYSRYWHGYLVILKPLLLITSFNSIRLLNGALQLIFVGICLILMTRKGATKMAGAFLGSIPFLFFVSTYASLSQSICLYVMLMAVIAMLVLDRQLLEKNLYGIFFLMIGMLTSYFDFLTYPIVTLCYPLCIYLYMHGESIKRDIDRLLRYSLEWGVGYLWMWSAKWMFADILSDATSLKDAIGTVFDRTQSAQGYGRGAGFLRVLRLNIAPYINWSYALLGLLIVVGLLAIAMRNRKHHTKEDALALIPFLCLSMYPFAWWFVTQNHSEEHWMYTCRIFGATVFSIVAGISKFVSKYKS